MSSRKKTTTAKKKRTLQDEDDDTMVPPPLPVEAVTSVENDATKKHRSTVSDYLDDDDDDGQGDESMRMDDRMHMDKSMHINESSHAALAEMSDPFKDLEIPVDDQDVVVQADGPSLPAPVVVQQVQAIQQVPCQWQLSNGDLLACIEELAAFHERLGSLKSVPEVAEDHPDAAVRVTEVNYLCDQLYNIWTWAGQPPDSDDATVVESEYRKRFNPMAIAFAIFFQKLVVTFDSKTIDDRYGKLKDQLVQLLDLQRMYAYGRKLEDLPDRNIPLNKLNCVRLAIQNAHRMLIHASSLKIAIDPTQSGIEPSKNVLLQINNFQSFAERFEDSGKAGRIITYLTQVAALKRYRRYRDGVYEEHITPDGHRTYFWKKVCTMEEFMKWEIQQENVDNKLWNDSLTINTKSILEYLTSMYHSEFPFIRLDRHVFAFRNGIYFATTRRFRPYGVAAKGIDWAKDSYIARREDEGKEWMRNSRFAGHGPTNAAANFFDMDFVDYMPQIRANPSSWFDIPTPTFDKLLNDQKIPVSAQKIVFGLVGRILYEVGELDDWQIILWFMGRAGSGKSTICKMAEIFYQSEDVAVISNNIEEQFGLGSVYDKLVFMAPEVKKDFRLSQAEFQSMVSGEKMSIARKFKDAASVMFKVPGILAGNDMPAWMDNSNSVVRRVALVMFHECINKVDGKISTRLRHEVAQMICKCNVAYHMMIEEYGDSGVWEKLPKYFHETQNDLKAKTHPVYHFLKSEKLMYGKDYFIPLAFCARSSRKRSDAFKDHFNNHARQNNLKRAMWSEELYSVPMADRGLTWRQEPEVRYGDQVFYNATVVYGVTWRDNGHFQPQEAVIEYDHAPGQVGADRSASKKRRADASTSAAGGSAHKKAHMDKPVQKSSTFGTFKPIPRINLDE